MRGSTKAMTKMMKTTGTTMMRYMTRRSSKRMRTTMGIRKAMQVVRRRTKRVGTKMVKSMRTTRW